MHAFECAPFCALELCNALYVHRCPTCGSPPPPYPNLELGIEGYYVLLELHYFFSFFVLVVSFLLLDISMFFLPPPALSGSALALKALAFKCDTPTASPSPVVVYSP